MSCSITRKVRPARPERADGLDQRAHQRRVDAGARLVEQDDARIAHQRARQLEELLLAARQRPRHVVGHPPEIHGLQDGERALADPALLVANAPRCREDPGEALARLAVGVDQHVLQHGHPPERARDLEGAPDTESRDRVRGQAVEPVGAETDLSAIGRREAADHVEERRLARAVRPDEAGDRAFGHAERAAGERLDAAEALGDAGHAEEVGRDAIP